MDEKRDCLSGMISGRGDCNMFTSDCDHCMFCHERRGCIAPELHDLYEEGGGKLIYTDWKISQAKTRLAEMDRKEAVLEELKQEAGIVPELKGVKMLVSDNNSAFVEAYVYGNIDGRFLVQGMIGRLSRYKYAKPLPTPKTAKDFRDHTLGEVMELGYVVTIEEKDS